MATQSTRRVQTFSIGFADAAFSELPYAREVAERYGTRHVEEIVTPDAADLLDDLEAHLAARSDRMSMREVGTLVGRAFAEERRRMLSTRCRY